MNNPNTEVFQYVGQCTAEYYNKFFNPNICHVCKSVDTCNLISCDQCCLIFYCSEEHKSAHYSYHVEICIITRQFMQVQPQKDMHKYSSWQQWIQSRKELMKLIQQKLDRPLEPYVQQMILWSKSCVVCHQQAELHVCGRCFSVNYCNKHLEDFRRKHHGAKCDQLMLSLNIDIEAISGNTTDMCYSFLPSIKDKGHFEEMLEFCIEYLLSPRENLNWLAKDYVQSDYLSGPLTIYCGLERIRSLGILQEKNIAIQIIAANSIDMDGLPAWEILLHLVPEIQTLSITLIGPEVKDGCKTVTLCELCTNKKNKLLFFSFSKLYHDYILLVTTIPNIIVGFHIDFSEEDTWSKSLKAIQAQNCPLFLTFSCKQKAQNNAIKIQKILGFPKEPFLNCRNLFGGLAPHKDLETGNIYFRNEHIMFYDDLHYYYNNSDSSSSE